MLRGLFWSFAAAFFAAAYLVPYRLAVESAPRLTAMTAMFVAAAIFNAGVALARPRRLRLDRLAVSTAAGLMLLTILANLLTALALPDIGAGMTSVVLKAQVILTPVLAFWVLGERASARLWGGGVVALAGVAAPALAEGGLEGTSGYLWALSSAACFAAVQIVTRKVIYRIQPAAVNALRLVMAVVVLHGLPAGRAVWSLPGEVWMWAATAGLMGPGLSRLCLMAAAKHISPSVTAVVALVGPVFAFGFEVAAFGQWPSARDLAGAALILVGIAWALVPDVARAVRARAAPS